MAEGEHETREAAGAARRPDSAQLVRQWAVLRLLADSGREWSVRDLAEQFGCSKPTIERDLATLANDFALVEEMAGKQKKLYRIDQRIKALEAVSFGAMELLSLHAAASALTSLAGAPVFEDLGRLRDKLRGFLAPTQNGGLDAMGKVFLAHPRGYVDYSGQHETIDDLVDAIARRKVCRLRYYAASTGATREHSLRPLRLVWHRASLYVLGCLGERAEVSTLALHRIETLELTAEVFTPPKVDVAAHIGRAFGIFVSDAEEEVEILFDPEAAWRVEERVFHPDERKERLPDGRLRYLLTTSAQWEIIPWVQQYGPLAELVRPDSWRRTLAENLAAAAAQYG